MPITALLLSLLVVGLAMAVAPKDNGDWRATGLVNTVQDIRDYINSNQADDAQGEVRENASGFSPLPKHLGGDVKLDDTVVMKVSTEMPQPLIGAVYDIYDGHSWSRSNALRRYRYLSTLWQAKRADVFIADKPSGGEAEQILFSTLTKPAEYEIVYFPYTRVLFYTGQILSIESRQFDLSEVYFNNLSEIFLGSPQKNLRYHFNTTVFNQSSADFDTDMFALETLALSAKDPQLDAINAQYLGLPENLPDTVMLTAEEVTADCTSPYAKALALETWLSQNCTYTLSPGPVPQNQDFVAYFLEQKQGYCDYYASALAVMARCVGLPSRYVMGYALKPNPQISSGKAYIATNATAHAWTEVYFQGIGWVAFDATERDFEQETALSAISDTSPSPTPAPSKQPVAQETDLKKETPIINFGVILIIISLVFATVLLLVFLRFVKYKKDAAALYHQLFQKYAHMGECVSACYHRVVSQTAFLSVPQQVGETMSQYAARVDHALGSVKMSEACKSVSLMRYANIEPTEKDLILLCELSDMLEQYIRRDFGFFKYLWRRLLINR